MHEYESNELHNCKEQYLTDYGGFSSFIENENQIFETDYEVLPQGKKHGYSYFTFDQYPDAFMFLRNEQPNIIGFTYNDFKSHQNHEKSGAFCIDNNDADLRSYNDKLFPIYSMGEYQKRVFSLVAIGFIPLKDGKKIIVCRHSRDIVQYVSMAIAIVIGFLIFFK